MPLDESFWGNMGSDSQYLQQFRRTFEELKGVSPKKDESNWESGGKRVSESQSSEDILSDNNENHEGNTLCLLINVCIYRESDPLKRVPLSPP